MGQKSKGENTYTRPATHAEGSRDNESTGYRVTHIPVTRSIASFLSTALCHCESSEHATHRPDTGVQLSSHGHMTDTPLAAPAAMHTDGDAPTGAVVSPFDSVLRLRSRLADSEIYLLSLTELQAHRHTSDEQYHCQKCSAIVAGAAYATQPDPPLSSSPPPPLTVFCPACVFSTPLSGHDSLTTETSTDNTIKDELNEAQPAYTIPALSTPLHTELLYPSTSLVSSSGDPAAVESVLCLACQQRSCGMPDGSDSYYGCRTHLHKRVCIECAIQLVRSKQATWQIATTTTTAATATTTVDSKEEMNDINDAKEEAATDIDVKETTVTTDAEPTDKSPREGPAPPQAEPDQPGTTTVATADNEPTPADPSADSHTAASAASVAWSLLLSSAAAHRAAVTIQRIFRGHHARAHYRLMSKDLPAGLRVVSIHSSSKVSKDDVASKHALLPMHLQLCTFCQHSTIVYHCVACEARATAVAAAATTTATAPVDSTSSEIPAASASPAVSDSLLLSSSDSCASCFELNHLRSSALRAHLLERQLIPGATDYTITRPGTPPPEDCVDITHRTQLIETSQIKEETEEEQQQEEQQEKQQEEQQEAQSNSLPSPVVVAPTASNSDGVPFERSREPAAAPILIATHPHHPPVPTHKAHSSSVNAAPFPDTRHVGVLEHVFTLLGQEVSGGAVGPALGGVSLPFTTLFRNSMPISTVATDRFGFVQCQSWSTNALADVLAKFGASDAERRHRDLDETVAVCFSMTSGVDAIAINAPQLRAIFGIVDEEETSTSAATSTPSSPHLLQHSCPRPRGNFILQRFRPSPGQHSTAYRVQADWSATTSSAAAPVVTQLNVSVCTNPHARLHGSNKVPLNQSLACKVAVTKEESLCTLIDDGASSSSSSPYSPNDESGVFLAVSKTLRAYIGSLGLGRPVRMSFVIAPTRKDEYDDDDVAEAFIPEEDGDKSSPAPPSIVRGDSNIRWNFCFADLLQLHSIEAESKSTLPYAANQPIPLKPIIGAKPHKKKATTAVKKNDPYIADHYTPNQSIPPSSLSHPPSHIPQQPPPKVVLDSLICAKCDTLFSPLSPRVPGVSRVGRPIDPHSGVLIMLKQVLLKWVPNSRYEYPEDLFHHVMGVDTVIEEPNWYRVIIKICQQCREEIRDLKTIPSRTQLAPWLAAAAAAGSPTKATRGHDAISISGGDVSEKAKYLPFLSRAPDFHPDSSGLGRLLNPPSAKKSHNVNKTPMSQLLSKKSKAGEEEWSRHQNRGMLHSNSTPTLDGRGAGAAANHNGALPALPPVGPISPFSSGQRRQQQIIQQQQQHSQPQFRFDVVADDYQDPRERDRERALAKAMKQSPFSPSSSSPTRTSPIRSSKSVASLQPLQSHGRSGQSASHHSPPPVTLTPMQRAPSHQDTHNPYLEPTNTTSYTRDTSPPFVHRVARAADSEVEEEVDTAASATATAAAAIEEIPDEDYALDGF